MRQFLPSEPGCGDTFTFLYDSLDDIADKTRLMAALDAINQRYGKGTMKVESADLDGDRRVWSMRQEQRTLE